MSGESVGAVVLAAGAARRMTGAGKIFVPLSGKPLLAWSVDTIHRCAFVQQVVVVLSDVDMERGARLCQERAWSKVVVCRGGSRRQDSVIQGLHGLVDCGWVIIHDGARPFVTMSLLEDGLRMAGESGAAVASVPVKDTIKLVEGEGWVRATLRRDTLQASQTPQVFRFDLLRSAYEGLTEDMTDDGAVVERLGCRVRLFAGASSNIKVTTREDLALAQIIAGQWTDKL